MDDYTRKLLRLYDEHKDDPRVFRGQSAALAGTDGKLIAGITGQQGGAMSREGYVTGEVDWHGQSVNPIRRRSPAERAESLANRFWQSVKDGEPAQTEYILRELYGEAWKAGMPISYQEVKQLAAELMRKAAAKAGASY